MTATKLNANCRRVDCAAIFNPPRAILGTAPVSIDTKCCAREEERGELTRCERAQELGEQSAPAPAHEDRSARRARSRLSKPSTT